MFDTEITLKELVSNLIKIFLLFAIYGYASHLAEECGEECRYKGGVTINSNGY